MDLASYIRKERTTNTAFAVKAGLSKSFIGRLVSGKCLPSWDVTLRIKAATDGKVTERDWGRRAAAQQATAAE